MEFAEPEHVDAALSMDNSLFRGRLIKVRHGFFDIIHAPSITNTGRLHRNAQTFLVSAAAEGGVDTGVVIGVDTVGEEATTRTVVGGGECPYFDLCILITNAPYRGRGRGF